ncbi:arsenic resistance protein [Bellilinea sp.]|jgi:ACR3 family arsenite efflux pump ArsB|uniref:Arsenic resistance protein n=1 Tax=Bellilinea caldifistulae TaxID=360411 RepID=A0A7C4Q057_9CHLR
MLKALHKTAKFIDQYMVIFLILFIIGGITFGSTFPAQAKGLKSYTTVTLFFMLYPMMIGLSIEQLGKALGNLKLISWSMIFNFLLSPLLAAGLAYLFLHHSPEFAVGLILTGTVPCAGMVAGWTGYAKGNVALALIIVVLSLLVSIVMIPIWMPILAGAYVSIDALGMLREIFFAVVIPLILGNLTRRFIFSKWGQDGFQKIKPILPAVSMLGMFWIVFISMALEAKSVLQNPQYVLIIFIPLFFFYTILFISSVAFSKWMKFTYGDMVAFVYGTAGKNISIALALAALFFSPLTVLVLALKPIIQIGFMATFLRILPKTVKWFSRQTAPVDQAVAIPNRQSAD